MTDAFVDTSEDTRFREFCEACRASRYIGLCFGAPGVGKTVSARRLANWTEIESSAHVSSLSDEQLEALTNKKVVYYTPDVVNSPSSVRGGLMAAAMRLRNIAREPTRRINRAHLDSSEDTGDRTRLARMWKIDGGQQEAPAPAAEQLAWPSPSQAHWIEPAQLVVIDEADRLRTSSLEEVRDMFDRSGVPVVLVGMPGIEKRLARHAQLYSRIGFVHAFKPLRPDELKRLLQRSLPDMAPDLPKNGFVDEDVTSAVVRMTAGNLRLVSRLLDQIRRVLTLNGLERIDRSVVDAARESLVIGAA